jgi:hypothetical protein
MEGREVVETQSAPPVLAVPVGGQDREREAQVVGVAVVDRPAIVGGVEEVRDPRCGIAGRKRGSGHAQEPDGSRSPGGRLRPGHRVLEGGAIFRHGQLLAFQWLPFQDADDASTLPPTELLAAHR